MKPKILGIDDHIQACLAEAHPKVSRYSQPLFAADEFGKPDLFATCVFIEIENIYYLVTAAHAIHEIESTGSPIYVGSTFINEIPSGGYIRSSEKGNDPLDIAAIPLRKEFIESEHIAVFPASKTTIGRSFQKQHINCMHGFPCSRNKQKNAVDFKTKKFTAYGFTYAGSVPKKVNFSQYKKDPDVHVCLNYSIGKDDQRKRTNPFKPKGMSGGGLWLIPNSFNCNNLFLKGILIEHIGKTVFATKIEKVIGFIKKNA